MENYDKLFFLPEEFKTKIEKEFGSLAKLYRMVYDLEMEKFHLVYPKSAEREIKIKAIDKSLDAIENKIDNTGIFGCRIIAQINDDFASMLMKEKLMSDAFYKKKFGNSYEDMKEWLENSSILKPKEV